ncbi:PH domain-containing protein [Saliterribacillus persicus]|nr:PH domain-containing protein [Saliterribacillus persicus]
MKLFDGLMRNASNVEKKEIMQDYDKLFVNTEEANVALKVIRG